MAEPPKQQSKAARIRELASQRMSVGAIADQIERETGKKCRYQQVYNVLKLALQLADHDEREKAEKAKIEKRPRPVGPTEIEEIPENAWEESE